MKFRLAAVFASLVTVCSAIEIQTHKKGLAINGGSLGNFDLAYPGFLNGAKEIYPLIEARTAGSKATLKYQGGGSVEVTATAAGAITFSFSGTPADVKSFATSVLIDISFNRGGQWTIGGQQGAFPKEKPTPPRIFSGNATRIAIANASGDQLNLEAPPFSFIQLDDNREWGWPIYSLKCFVPMSPDTTQATFQIVVQKGHGDARILDPFGQSTLEEWPAKIKSADELTTDATAEAAYYAGQKTPARDEFGGLADSGRSLGLIRTGFFHLEPHGGKSWLVDPAGNVFFHTGVCGFQPSDDYTYIQGRENIYGWLPAGGDAAFATAFRKDDPTAFSFYIANTIRKYGQPYDFEAFSSRMIDRVRQFGFNSIGSFSEVSAAAKTKNFPYVATLPLNKWDTAIKAIPGTRDVWDPFDESTRAIIETTLADKLPARADEPLLIGYFVVNEPGYDELPKVIPSLAGDQACKRRFVAFLQAKYQDIRAYNTAWKATAACFDDLAGHGLAVATDAANADAKAFTGILLEELCKLVETNFRKHDHNHLLLGYRLQPIATKDQQLCEIIGKYVDVFSYNYYTPLLDKEQLKQIHQWSGGKPMMLSEFFWSSPGDSGLSGGIQTRTQQERGLTYRNYVEQAAALGFVIGIEWFTLIDQAATGRWFSQYSGEGANSGLFSVADRPWKPMLEEMAKTNHGIYDVLSGKRPPFAWKPPVSRGE